MAGLLWLAGLAHHEQASGHTNPNLNQACRVSLSGLEDTDSLSTLYAGITLLSATPAFALYARKATEKVDQLNSLQLSLQLLGVAVATAISPLPFALLVNLLGTLLQGETVDEGDVITVFEFTTVVVAGATAGWALSEALRISRALDESNVSNNPSLAALIGGLFTVVFTKVFNLPF